MKTRVALYPALLALLVAGCAQSKSASTSPPPAAKPIVGTWKGKIEMAKGKEDDPAAKMAEAMTSMFGDIDLEVKEGDRYVMKVMGMPMEGAITRSGSKLTFKHDKIMGMTPAELKAQNEKAGKATPEDPNAPMDGEVSADGETITLMDPKQPDSKLVFRRHIEKPKEVGASTVAAAEAPFVGSYKPLVDPARVKPEDKKMLEALKDSIFLKLESDNTFTMSVGMDMEGTWKVQGAEVILTMSKVAGMKASTNDKPAKFKILGTKLEPIPTEGDDVPPFSFVKG